MLEYFLSPAKADLLPTDGASSARSDPPWLRACKCPSPDQATVTVTTEERASTTAIGLARDRIGRLSGIRIGNSESKKLMRRTGGVYEAGN